MSLKCLFYYRFIAILPDNINKELGNKNMAVEYETDLAQKRRNQIEVIAASGNVGAACQKLGMSRSQYYELKRRYEQHGLEGLLNRSSAHHTHPSTTTPEVEKQIVETSLEHPAWGSDKLREHFHKKEIRISAFTIHKIMRRNKLGNRQERYLYFEDILSHEDIDLTDEQRSFLEKFNPAYRDWDIRIDFPGQLLYQDTILMGRLHDLTKVYMHTVVDSYSSYAFSLLLPNSDPEGAVKILEDITIPFFNDQGLKLFMIATGDRDTFRSNYIYWGWLKRNDIRSYTKTEFWKIGAIERFKRTVNKELFRTAFSSGKYASLDSLQEALNSWLHSYNYERPIHGYPNFGERPIERMLDDY